MKVVVNPAPETWNSLLARPVQDLSEIKTLVQPIMDKVAEKGDKALIKLAKKFDNAELSSVLVSQEEMEAAPALVSAELKEAIGQAYANIEKFHRAQWQNELVVETTPGVWCRRKSVPIQKVGLYVPGGTAPLFSTVLMLGVPAKIAGCRQVVLCTPPNAQGQVHPAILYAARLVGVHTIVKAGGAQAVAAMAFGTESVPAVYKIFGPGNQFVTAAKQMVSQQGIAIDMPAGPSEVAVLANETSNPAFVAADLLSQAEHGKDSQVVLVSTHQPMLKLVHQEVLKQLDQLPRKEMAQKALDNSVFIYASTLHSALALLNAYAAEHLILAIDDAETVSEHIENAGSIFLGHYTPESAGDYASGTNHTLPTNGFAMAYSGVSTDSFVKKITLQQLSPQGIQQLGPTIETMAEAEELFAHKNAVTLRLNALKKNV